MAKKSEHYLQELIDELKMTANEFSNSLGFERADRIYHVLNGRNDISPDLAKIIIDKYSNVNYDWLLTGEGSMLKSSNGENFPHGGIPLYALEATAGLVSLFLDTKQVPIDYLNIPNAPKCDGAITVRGDSMYPILKSGDIVCFRKINMENIRYGEMYILDIYDGDDQYLTIKYVQKSELGSDYVNLVSHNAHHSPKDERIDHIRSLALVKLSIRYNNM